MEKTIFRKKCPKVTLRQISPEVVDFEVPSLLAHPSPPQTDMPQSLLIKWGFIFYIPLTCNILQQMSKKAISDYGVEKSH